MEKIASEENGYITKTSNYGNVYRINVGNFESNDGACSTTTTMSF
jgi:hypothetical protein